MIQNENKIEDFDFKDHLNNNYYLSDFLGKKVVFYFYYQNEEGWCLEEALNFKLLNDEFDKYNTVIIGVSENEIESNLKFVKENDLPFILVSDKDLKIAKTFNAFSLRKVLKKEYYLPIRSTFLINEEGYLIKEWKPASVNNNALEVLNFIKYNK